MIDLFLPAKSTCSVYFSFLFFSFFKREEGREYKFGSAKEEKRKSSGTREAFDQMHVLVKVTSSLSSQKGSLQVKASAKRYLRNTVEEVELLV